MIRVVILIVLIYLLYRLIRTAIGGPRLERTRRVRKQGGKTPVEDEMVKDPQCGVYVPKREAVTAKVEGEKFYFCCEDCKKAFLETHRTSN